MNLSAVVDGDSIPGFPGMTCGLVIVVVVALAILWAIISGDGEDK